MKTSFVVTGLSLLVLANVLMVTRFFRKREGFQAAKTNLLPNTQAAMMATSGGNEGNGMLSMANRDVTTNAPVTEGFTSFLLSNAGGAKEKYQSIGGYDGIVLPTGNNVSSWRYTAPNEPLMGSKFVPVTITFSCSRTTSASPNAAGRVSAAAGAAFAQPRIRDSTWRAAAETRRRLRTTLKWAGAQPFFPKNP